MLIAPIEPFKPVACAIIPPGPNGEDICALYGDGTDGKGFVLGAACGAGEFPSCRDSRSSSYKVLCGCGGDLGGDAGFGTAAGCTGGGGGALSGMVNRGLDAGSGGDVGFEAQE